MSKEIDVLKPPLINICSLCSEDKLYIDPYKVKIKPSKHLWDLIYSDVSDLYIWNFSMVKYYITFLDNYNKTLEVVLLSSKNEVLAAFVKLCLLIYPSELLQIS